MKRVRGIQIIEHLMRPYAYWHPMFPAPLVEAMLQRARARRASDA